MKRILFCLALVGLVGCKSVDRFLADDNERRAEYVKQHDCEIRRHQPAYDYLGDDATVQHSTGFTMYRCAGLDDDVIVHDAK